MMLGYCQLVSLNKRFSRVFFFFAFFLCHPPAHRRAESAPATQSQLLHIRIIFRVVVFFRLASKRRRVSRFCCNAGCVCVWTEHTETPSLDCDPNNSLDCDTHNHLFEFFPSSARQHIQFHQCTVHRHTHTHSRPVLKIKSSIHLMFFGWWCCCCLSVRSVVCRLARDPPDAIVLLNW